MYTYINLNGAVVPVCTFRVLGFGFWVLGFGFWFLGFLVLEFGFWIWGFGFWILGFGFWILSWTLEAPKGPWRPLRPLGFEAMDGLWRCKPLKAPGGHGAVVPVCTFRVLGFGFWVLGFGFWILGFGFWVLGFGFWVLDFGFWVLGFRFWVLDFGLDPGGP